DRRRVGDADIESALGRRPRLDRLLPALEVGEFLDVLSLALPAQRPSDTRHVGDRIFAGQEIAVGQTPVHHAIEAIDFVGIAFDSVLDWRGRVVAEMVGLPGHRTKPAHLPEQPLVDFNALALVRRIELAGLTSEVLQDRTRLEHRDWPAARSLRID